METLLYQPVKAFLEAAGYAVKGEIGSCDLVGLSVSDPSVVVVCELKLSFNLELILEAVDRASIADEVWIAARISAKGKGRSPDAHYDTMSLDQVKTLPVAEWAADDAILLL